MSNAERIAKGLQKARKSGSGWSACCPSHEDHEPSLSITDAGDKPLVRCHAGCDQAAVVDALKARGLWPEQTDSEWMEHEGMRYPRAWGRMVRFYDYTDERGDILFRSCRFEPKSFKQCRPAGDGWRWGLAEVRRVPYRLPELLEAAIIFIAEGERDCEALRDFGFCATCNPIGAGKWRPEFNQFFSGKEVCILPDADPPGWKHALDIARGIVGIAAKVQMLELPGAKDAAEWFAQGHSELELIELLEAPCHQ